MRRTFENFQRETAPDEKLSLSEWGAVLSLVAFLVVWFGVPFF